MTEKASQSLLDRLWDFEAAAKVKGRLPRCPHSLWQPVTAHTACDNLWQPTQPVTTLLRSLAGGCGFNDPEWLGYDWIGDMKNVSN